MSIFFLSKTKNLNSLERGKLNKLKLKFIIMSKCINR